MTLHSETIIAAFYEKGWASEGFEWLKVLWLRKISTFGKISFN